MMNFGGAHKHSVCDRWTSVSFGEGKLLELILVDSPHLTQCRAATGWIRFLGLDWGSLCWKWVMSFSVLGGAVTQRAWRLISYGKKRVDQKMEL